MKRLFFALAIFSIDCIAAFEKLPEEYRVTYGKGTENVKVTEYFSFACPHCVAIFRESFSQIKKEFIEDQNVYWEFHPIPLDMTTVLAMRCLEKLTPEQKKIFLEVMLEESDIENAEITVKLMKKAMEIFEKSIPDLDEEESIKMSKAYQDSFKFLKQEGIVETIPSISVNGILYRDEVPDFDFVRKIIRDSR